MDLVNQLFPAFAAGLSGAVLLWVWRKFTARSETWFPLFKRGAKLLLWSWALASAGTALYGVANAADLKLAMASIIAGFCAPVVVGLLGRKRGAGDEVKRSQHVVASGALNKAVKTLRKTLRLSLAGVRLPFDSEPHHLLVAGSADTDKSAVISSVLDQLREAGDTVIVVDSGGALLSKHFVEGTDFVFNPFDGRCINWSPDFEMQGEWDAEALARSMVPDGVDGGKERDVQTLLASVLRQLWSEKRLNLPTLLYYVQAASVAELRDLLAGTPAMAQLTSDHTFGTIRSIASTYLTPYTYLPNSGTRFSVNEMIRAEHSGVLFATYRDDQLDSLRSLIGCVLDVAARTILSLSPDENRRVWLIIDDFASIGRVQSIESVAAKAHKVGGCLLIGLQSISQLRERYGDAGAQAILSSMSSWLVMRCADQDTAEYLSKYIGDVELLRQQQNDGETASGESRPQDEQPLTQRAVVPSQIQALPKLQGFLRLAGNLPVAAVKMVVPKKPRATMEAAFCERDFGARPMLKLPATMQTPLSAAATRAAASLNTPAVQPDVPVSRVQESHSDGTSAPASSTVRPPSSATGAFHLRRSVPLPDSLDGQQKGDMVPTLIDEGHDLPSDSRVLVTRGSAPLKSMSPLRAPSADKPRKSLNNVSLI